MKLKEFKKILDKMSKEELEEELIYNSDEYGFSGIVNKLKKASSDLYYTGDDDPSQLFTKTQLKNEGWDKEQIEEAEIEIPKGRYYIELT